MHIPKTAGTSITSLLEDNMSLVDSMIAKKIRTSYYNNCVDYDLIASARLVAGHIPLAIASLMRPPVNKIVFLRDPVELSISIFNYMKKSGELGQSVDLGHFIKSKAGESIRNIQTKWLATAFIPNMPIHRPAMPFEFGRNVERSQPLVNEAVLSVAKERLEQFEFIGFFDRVDQSMAAMCDKFGLCLTHESPALNVTRYDKIRDELLVQAVAAQNEFDMELFRFARRASKSGEFQDIDDDIPLSPYASLDMDDVIRHKGLHAREIWPHWHGVRWTSDTSYIYPDCELLPNVEYVCELLILAMIEPENASQLQVFINDLPINCSVTASVGMWRLCGVLLTMDRIRRPVLKIIVPFAKKPSVVGLSADNRTLGVAVKSIKLMPVESCAIRVS